ncbi:GNAT family N-acetyltransferase [Paenibacillus sp. CF384]|uniref:GNAT family N-acetyltransferase n=1 Tax=Paenibacillus sp. CF384 TaxID=1884382 RepID=UPI00089D06DE|nr:GNAT family N-acetyltransferase [Paenibacillus sp. CF384]SDX66494.1 mycothiol synthase [Paenibacillus sp. CF384]
MSEQQHSSQLFMVREDISTLPALTLPAGYGVRSLQPGDEKAWEHIINDSFGGNHPFDREMASDEPYTPERVWFITDEQDVPIATASAWFRPQFGESTGYLHMVGLLQSQGGKKLGLYVSLAALLHMAREGFTRAVLNTDDYRIPAVKTYLNLGFVPVCTDSGHHARWQALANKLNCSIDVIQLDGTPLVLEPHS